MGLVGVIISSGAGCISVALSLLAIRRIVRRRKCQNRKRTTDLRLTTATGVTANNANGAQATPFIKTSTSEMVQKRRAVIVQMHYGKPTVSKGPFGIHENTEKGYALDTGEGILSNGVQEQDENAAVFLHDRRTISSQLKEFTVIRSSGIARDDHSTHRDFLEGNLFDDGNISADSCSETESCSFADDEFLSEDELVGTTTDERRAESDDKTLEISQPCPKRAKRVSFQFTNSLREQRELQLSNSRADHENPVAENVLAIENLLQAEDVEIVLGNEDVHNDTSGSQSGLPARVLEVMDRGVLMGRSGGSAMTQVYSEGNDNEQGTVFHMGKHDKTPAKARKPFFVSVEPLAQMPALDEALNLSPTTSSPEMKGYPVSWAVDTSEPDSKNSKDCDERDSTSAAHLQKECSQTSYRCSEDEKENVSGIPTSSLGRLSRKARRDVERPVMFRRSSYPSLRRFRFSDRIKVRPLRSSGRNSK